MLVISRLLPLGLLEAMVAAREPCHYLLTSLCMHSKHHKQGASRWQMPLATRTYFVLKAPWVAFLLPGLLPLGLLEATAAALGACPQL